MAQNNYIRRLLANKTALQVASSQRPTDELVASSSTNINKYKDYELYVQFSSPVPEPSQPRPLERIKEIDVPAKNGTDPLSKHMDPDPDNDACPAFFSLQDLTPDEMASSFVQFLFYVFSFFL